MKTIIKYFQAILILLLTDSVGAQVSTDKNFILTVIPKQPGMHAPENINNLPPHQKAGSIDYMDGLGRKVQTVIPYGSTESADIVTPIKYDQYGRIVEQYLPYVSADNPVKYRDDWSTQQPLFYGSVASSNNDLPDNHPYGINIYDNSPLNRVISTFAPGDDWAGSQGNSPERSVNTLYTINSDEDKVENWELDYSLPFPTPVIGYYRFVKGDLFKTVSTDEHGIQTVEFKDKNGNIILKKVQLENAVSGDYPGWLCTYYVYDNLGRLRFVLPPQLTKLLVSQYNWQLNANLIFEYSFWYIYDDRGRIITKHVPGSEPIDMVYDKRDRLVLTQDGNLRKKQTWLVTLYDFVNRPLVTALWENNYNRLHLQTELDNDLLSGDLEYGIIDEVVFINNKPSVISVADLDVQTLVFYDNYESNWAQNSPFQTDFVLPYSHNTVIASGDYAEDVAANELVPGKQTGAKAKILDLDPNAPVRYTRITTYYDKEYRPIQVLKKNHLTNNQALDMITTQYDFTSKVLGTFERHYVQQTAPGGTVTTILTKNVYDPQGRLIEKYKGVNSNEANKLIVRNEYDALGRLKSKKIGEGTIGENTQNYTYNIRGWLRGVNIDKLDADIKPTSGYFFGYELGYTNSITGGTPQNPQYNGNIASMVWASAGKAGRDMQGIWQPLPDENGIKRKYEYLYFNSNWLKKAEFSELKNSNWNTTEKDFSTENSYDYNGNILSMIQMGVKDGQVEQIDNLEYHYYHNDESNRLLSVDDAANDPSTTLGDFKEECGIECPGRTGIDYVYDDNGNMIKDLNKLFVGSNLSQPGISYNYLNLPETVSIYDMGQFTNKGKIGFVYDALGNKLQKKISDNSSGSVVITTIDYIDGLVYENQELKEIPHEEGRIRYAMQPSGDREFKYDWFLKDHLGNIRMVVTEEPDPIDARIYKASFEDQATAKVSKKDIEKEKELFGEDMLSATRGEVPSELKETDKENNKCSILKPGNKDAQTPYKILKVSPGDKFTIGVQYYYRPDAKKQQGQHLREDILKNLVNNILGPGGVKEGLGKDNTINPLELLQSPNVNENDLHNFLKDDDDRSAAGSRPRAYLNYIFMDTTLKFIKGGAIRVGDIDPAHPEWKNIVQENLQAAKKGYFLVYLSNEGQMTSNLNSGLVYFDNLVIVTNEGPIMEENHYYPFGLLMDAISTSGSGKLKNKYKYNGKELNQQELGDGSGLDLYDFGARMYDQQIGRWITIDPLAIKFSWQSPYIAMDNNPCLKTDPTGMSASPIYDQNGIFLGTDDQGLQGKAIIMRNYEFTQGMKHEDAMKKDLAPKGGDDFKKAITSATGYRDFYYHYNNLPSRPDYDGLVEIKEGINWAKSHPGALKHPTPDNTLYIDASKLDFGNITISDFRNGVGKVSPINLNTKGNFTEAQINYILASTVYALGRVNIKLLNHSGSVKIVNDPATDYDWNKGGSFLGRGGLIYYERLSEGLNDTHGFKTFYYGIGQLRP